MGAKRAYSSELRQAQARQTRRAIVGAATALFVERGYAATTIDAVAAAAGVSRKTVFASVGGKAELLKLAWDWAIAGDDEPVVMADRPAVAEMRASTDPARVVDLWVAMVMGVTGRVSPMGTAIRAAVDVEPVVAEQFAKAQHERHVGALAFVRHLASIGGLTPGRTVEEAADLCWCYMDPYLFHQLVEERGWSVERYHAWLAETMRHQLLDR